MEIDFGVIWGVLSADRTPFSSPTYRESGHVEWENLRVIEVRSIFVIPLQTTVDARDVGLCRQPIKSKMSITPKWEKWKIHNVYVHCHCGVNPESLRCRNEKSKTMGRWEKSCFLRTR